MFVRACTRQSTLTLWMGVGNTGLLSRSLSRTVLYLSISLSRALTPIKRAFGCGSSRHTPHRRRRHTYKSYCLYCTSFNNFVVVVVCCCWLARAILCLYLCLSTQAVRVVEIVVAAAAAAKKREVQHNQQIWWPCSKTWVVFLGGWISFGLV